MNANRLLVGLDAAQRRAVQSEAAPLAIVASAGSGKTTVLTRRIAHRIELGQAEPRHIVALTFTRDAAGELRRRLRRLEIHESIEAGTFHSIALRLLRDRALTLNESMPSLAPDRLRLVRECLKELRLELDPYPAMTDIDWARARRIEPADYERQSRAARRRGAVPSGRFTDLAAAYERLKRRRGVVDFDDLLDLNLRAVETDAAFRSLVHWRFRHFFVDEAQDLNPLQHALLEAWRGGRPDICLVGDPRQAIYGWNGSDHTTMTEVERVYPGVTVISLATNYRCSPQVVSAGAAALIASGQIDDTASNRPDGVPLRIESYPTAEAEAAAIAAFVRTSLHQHNPAGIAILARTNDQLIPIENALGVGGHCHATRSRTVAAGDRAQRRLPHDQPRGAGSVGRRAVHASRSHSTSCGRGSRPVPHVAGTRWVPQLGRPRSPFDDLDVDVDDGAVSLLTFHGAKGREWPVVVVAGAEDGLIPHSSALSTAQQAEEARLLYVAITRAVDHLVITACRVTPRLLDTTQPVARSGPGDDRRRSAGGTAATTDDRVGRRSARRTQGVAISDRARRKRGRTHDLQRLGVAQLARASTGRHGRTGRAAGCHAAGSCQAAPATRSGQSSSTMTGA